MWENKLYPRTEKRIFIWNTLTKSIDFKYQINVNILVSIIVLSLYKVITLGNDKLRMYGKILHYFGNISMSIKLFKIKNSKCQKTIHLKPEKFDNTYNRDHLQLFT
jgi:hypothetical protein